MTQWQLDCDREHFLCKQMQEQKSTVFAGRAGCTVFVGGGGGGLQRFETTHLLSAKNYVPIQLNCILNYVWKIFCSAFRLSQIPLRTAAASDVVQRATCRAGDVVYRATVNENTLN